MVSTLNLVSYSNWVCPKCKGILKVEGRQYSCEPCELRFSEKYGIPDFRLNNYDSENQLNLAEEYLKLWDKLTYEDMVRMRFSGLRQRALAAGKNPCDPKMWDLDEQAHLASYRTRGKYHSHILKHFLRRSDQAEHSKRLIDVGCGWGRDLLHLAGLGDEVIGVDVSTYSLLMTKKLLQENGVTNVTLVLAEGQFLPVPSQCIDGINCSATIEHFPLPGDFLRECSRCMREPGWVFLYYPNRYSALPETHTGIWGLGFRSEKQQKKVVRKRIGSEWNVTLFSRRSFFCLLGSTCEYKSVRITGIPDGIEEFLYSSKFAKMFPRLARVPKVVLPIIRVMPGLDRLISFFAPVHFVLIRW